MQNNNDNTPRRKCRARRVIKWSLITLLSVVVLAIGAAIAWLGPLAEWFVEKYDLELMGRQLEMENLRIKLFSGEASAQNIILYEQDDTTPFVSLGDVKVEMALKDIFDGHIHLTRATLDSLYAHIDQSAEAFNFDDMLEYIAVTYASEEEPAEESEPWLITLDNLAISNGHLLYYDQELAQRWELTQLNVTTPSFYLDDRFSHIDASMTINDVATLAGAVELNYATWDFLFDGSLREFPFAETYNYLKPYLNIGSITGSASADLSIKGNVMNIMAMTLSGEASTKGFGLTTSVGGKVLESDELSVGIEEIDLANNRYLLSRLEANGFSSEMEFNADGTTNFDPLFYNDPTVVIESTATQQGDDLYEVKERVTVTTSDDESLLEDMVVRIGKVSLRGGDFRYADHTLHREFEYELSDIFIAGDSLDLMNRNKIMLGAQLPKQGSVMLRWDGSLSDFHNQSLMLMLNNVDMVGISPYLEHFTGFPIKDGNLTFRSQNVITNGGLSGINQFGTYNFKVGKRDKSIDPEIKLPLRLAVFMLTDKDEHIDIDLPVSGHIDSPKFSYGRIIMKAVGGLMVKLLVSPFEFLSGDKQDAFRYINIDIMEQGLSSEHYARLDKMAEALKQDSTVRVRLTQRVNHHRAAQRIANMNLKIAYYNNTYGHERGFLDMLAISQINQTKMSNKEVLKYADSLLVARGIDPTHMNSQAKAMALYGDKVDGQLKMLMERRNRIINDYMSFQHQDLPEGSFTIAPVVIDDMKSYHSKDRYTVTLIIDEQEVELPVDDNDTEADSQDDATSLDDDTTAEDNIPAGDALAEEQTAETTQTAEINN